MPLEVLDLAFVFLSCFFSLKVPKLRRLPVLGSFFLEYIRYSPDFNFLIIAASNPLHARSVPEDSLESRGSLESWGRENHPGLRPPLLCKGNNILDSVNILC